MCRVNFELLNDYYHVLLLVLVQQGHLVYGGDFLDPYDELLDHHHYVLSLFIVELVLLINIQEWSNMPKISLKLCAV